jgi:hypothetical protein
VKFQDQVPLLEADVLGWLAAAARAHAGPPSPAYAFVEAVHDGQADELHLRFAGPAGVETFTVVAVAEGGDDDADG